MNSFILIYSRCNSPRVQCNSGNHALLWTGYTIFERSYDSCVFLMQKKHMQRPILFLWDVTMVQNDNSTKCALDMSPYACLVYIIFNGSCPISMPFSMC